MGFPYYLKLLVVRRLTRPTKVNLRQTLSPCGPSGVESCYYAPHVRKAESRLICVSNAARRFCPFTVDKKASDFMNAAIINSCSRAFNGHYLVLITKRARWQFCVRTIIIIIILWRHNYKNKKTGRRSGLQNVTTSLGIQLILEILRVLSINRALQI